MSVLLRKGNRLFTFAWSLFTLAALGHSMSTLPDEPAVSAAVDAMEQATFGTGTALQLSLMDVFKGAWLQIGVLMVALAVLNLTVVAVAGGDRKVKRALLLVDLALCAALIVVFVVYPIPPPLIVFAVMGLLLGVDLVGTAREPGRAG